MTPFEQFLAAARFEKTPHVPVVGAVTPFFMEPLTSPPKELSPREAMVFMLQRGAELFPGIPLIFMENPTPALYPAMRRRLLEIRETNGVLSTADFAHLDVPNPDDCPEHIESIEETRWFSRNISDDLKSEYGYCNGLIRFENPFDYLCELVGSTEWFASIVSDPDFVLAAMETFTEASVRGALSFAKEFGTPQWVMLAEDFPGYIRPKDFERFVLPFHQKILGTFPNAVKLLHNDSNASHILPQIAACGADIFHFGPEVDVATAKRAMGNRTALMGNLSPMHVMLRGSDGEFRADIERIIRDGMPGGGFVLATGGEVNPGADPARMNLMLDLARDIGQY
jgi:hypothetical protein